MPASHQVTSTYDGPANSWGAQIYVERLREERKTELHARRPPTVLTIAFPYAPIGLRAVGGAEVICTRLESALPALGFHSVVVAHAASECVGSLYPTCVLPGMITDEVRANAEAAQQANIDRVFAEHRVSLVHMHGLDFARYRLPQTVPIVVTLHLPPSWYPTTIWSSPANYHFICVSESQRLACPPTVRGSLTVIENGVDVDNDYAPLAGGKYALMLARICPEKNLHMGFDAARLVQMPAVLGGNVYPYATHLRYFREEIGPRLTASGEAHESRGNVSRTGSTARFVGPVSGTNKKRLLGRAACLLMPSLAPETSSLVAMEALAAGTPVIGMAVGAMPEIVEHGRTGFLVEPDEGAVQRMAAAMKRLPEINRALCGQVAKTRFPGSRMINKYCELYRRLAPESPWKGAVADCVVATREAAVCRESTMRGLDPLVENITKMSALEALAQVWTDLFHVDSHATPFQHPGWLIPWWRQFGVDGELHTLMFRQPESAEVVGILPLYIYKPRGMGERTLLLMGAGTTDYLGGVWTTDSTIKATAARCALSHVLCKPEYWDHANLYQLRAGSALRQAAEPFALSLVVTEPCFSVDVALQLPAKIRANTGRYRRRAEALGRVECRWACTSHEARCYFEALVAMHSHRWKGRGEAGVLDDERVLAHHRESLPWLVSAGLLRMLQLSVSGETAGVLYAFADAPHAVERRLYLYLIGFAPRFAECSPGTLLIREAWKYAREHGFSKLDLLRGGEVYKQFWGVQMEKTFGINLEPELSVAG